jgi:hypothetical protein
LEYKGTPLRCKYEPDFVCYEEIILELKAVRELADEHRAQVQNYLRATGFSWACWSTSAITRRSRSSGSSTPAEGTAKCQTAKYTEYAEGEVFGISFAYLAYSAVHSLPDLAGQALRERNFNREIREIRGRGTGQSFFRVFRVFCGSALPSSRFSLAAKGP